MNETPENTAERCWCDLSSYRPHPQQPPYHPRLGETQSDKVGGVRDAHEIELQCRPLRDALRKALELPEDADDAQIITAAAAANQAAKLAERGEHDA